MQKTMFIDAYMVLYGSTRKQAEQAYKKAVKAGETSYINAIIAYLTGNAKKAFWND